MKVLRYLNAELADTLGNLLSRCTGAALNPFQTFPKIMPLAFDSVSSLDVTKNLLECVQTLPGRLYKTFILFTFMLSVSDICHQHYDNLNFYKAVDAIMATLRANNLFFETLKPWELKKNPNSQEELKVVLHLTLETLRVTGILLQPIIPNLSKILLDKLNIPCEQRYLSNLQKFSWEDDTFKDVKLSSEKVVLFKRIVDETAKKIIVNK